MTFPSFATVPGTLACWAANRAAVGVGLPLLQDIQGRSTDFVVAANGTVMHGLSLIYILRDLSGVQFFKVVQESRALTRVLLVTDGAFEEQSVERIIAGFKRRLGAEVQVVVERVDSIPAEKSGKFRYIISHA